MITQIQKKKIGRPAIMDSKLTEKLETALCGGYSITSACYFAGVSTSTFYEYKSLDKDFSDRMTRAQEYATFRARQIVLRAIDNGDVKAAMWWLERKSRGEFAPPKSM